MTAHSLLEQTLAGFRQAVTGADFREAYGGERVERLLARPVVTGEVSRETEEGGDWETRLMFRLYLPRGKGPDAAGSILDGMAAWVKENQALLVGYEQGGASVDKATGSVVVSWTVKLAKPGSGSSGQSGKRTYKVYLNGEEYTVTGWKASAGEFGDGLTAIGEDVPFARKSGKEYTVELQGLAVAGLEELEGFTLRLGAQQRSYAGCRWKSLSAGGTGVLTSPRMILEEE